VGNTSVPVVIRNNNPAALSLMRPGTGEFAEQQEGYVGATPRPKAEGGYYAKYKTPEHGVAANAELLKRYGQRGINTPDQIVRKWSVNPAAHANYSRTIQRALGVSGNTRLNLNDPEVQAKVLEAQSGHESGRGKSIYTPDVIRRGVNRQFESSPTGSDAVARYNEFRNRFDHFSGAAGATISADRATNNQNVKVDAPINITVRDGAEAKRVASSGINNAVKAGAALKPSRMQSGPAR
jgi:hypothetical protein